uniref:Uncharacterized protein n=1 Tax=Chenopodium quinoa TaxID=63459 RepID=A0A803KUD6_CHEQI
MKMSYFEDREEQEEPEPNLEVSLCSVVGISNPKPMKLRGVFKGRQVVVMIDSGATHNFISITLVEEASIPSTEGREFGVSLGNGDIVRGVNTDGSDAVAEAEAAVLESLSSHVRAVVATLGGKHGAAGRADKWRHLYAGLTVWLSQSAATDEYSAKEEAKKQVYEGSESYSKADVVVKFDSWDACYAKAVAQASLSALKQLILSDKKLPGKKSLYIRLGCRGDWPNIKPPGWDPSSPTSMSTNA